MTSRQSRFAVAVLVFSAAVLLTSTQSALAQHCTPGTTVNVNLKYNAGQCQQIIMVGGHPMSQDVVQVNVGYCVTWQPDTANQSFDVQFPRGTTPFFEFGDPKGSPVSSGPGNGPVNTNYYYQSVTVNGQSCNNASSLGIVMR